jgi:hypothetical protein
MTSVSCAKCGLVSWGAEGAACKRCGADVAFADSYAAGHQLSYAGAGTYDVAAAPEAGLTPPRALGILLAILGVVLGFAGAYLLAIGYPSPYFMVIGVGIAISGVLIASGKRAGMYVYFATFGVIVVWSLIETAGTTGQLMPRLFIPTLICLHLAREKVRARLS